VLALALFVVFENAIKLCKDKTSISGQLGASEY